eukprot:s1629_g8.t1
MRLTYTAANSDLWKWILDSMTVLGNDRVQLVKIAAHKQLVQARARRELWSFWHNGLVDKVAKHANINRSTDFWDLWQTHVKQVHAAISLHSQVCALHVAVGKRSVKSAESETLDEVVEREAPRPLRVLRPYLDPERHPFFAEVEMVQTMPQSFLESGKSTGVALSGIDRHFVDLGLRFAWQAWRLVTWAFTFCGRRGAWGHRLSLCVAALSTYGTGLVTRLEPAGLLVAGAAAAVCVAGVVLGGMDLRFCVAGVALAALGWVLRGLKACWSPVTPRLFAWQAWRLVTWTFVLRGRRGARQRAGFSDALGARWSWTFVLGG